MPAFSETTVRSDKVLFASAARIASENGSLRNLLPGLRGATFVVDITAITGTGAALVVTIQAFDAASGKWVDVLASASLTAAGTTVLRVYPGLTAAVNLTSGVPMPSQYRVALTISGTTPSITCSVGVQEHA